MAGPAHFTRNSTFEAIQQNEVQLIKERFAESPSEKRRFILQLQQFIHSHPKWPLDNQNLASRCLTLIPVSEKHLSLIRRLISGSAESLHETPYLIKQIVKAGDEERLNFYYQNGLLDLSWRWDGLPFTAQCLARCSTEMVLSMIVPEKLNQQDRHSLFMTAIAVGDDKAVEVFLKKMQFDPNCSGKNDWTPLHEAFLHGELDIAELLIEAGGSLNTSAISGQTPLHIGMRSSYCEDLDLVAFFSHYSVDYGKKDEEGSNYLYHAFCYHCPRLISFLIDHGVDLNEANRSGFTPLHLCRNLLGVKEKYRNAIVKKLAEHPLNLGMQCYRQGNTPLHYLCRFHPNQTDFILQLLKHRAAAFSLLFVENKTGQTPLLYLMHARNDRLLKTIYQWLLESSFSDYHIRYFENLMAVRETDVIDSQLVGLITTARHPLAVIAALTRSEEIMNFIDGSGSKEMRLLIQSILSRKELSRSYCLKVLPLLAPDKIAFVVRSLDAGNLEYLYTKETKTGYPVSAIMLSLMVQYYFLDSEDLEQITDLFLDLSYVEIAVAVLKHQEMFIDVFNQLPQILSRIVVPLLDDASVMELYPKLPHVEKLVMIKAMSTHQRVLTLKNHFPHMEPGTLHRWKSQEMAHINLTCSRIANGNDSIEIKRELYEELQHYFGVKQNALRNAVFTYRNRVEIYKEAFCDSYTFQQRDVLGIIDAHMQYSFKFCEDIEQTMAVVRNAIHVELPKIHGLVESDEIQELLDPITNEPMENPFMDISGYIADKETWRRMEWKSPNLGRAVKRREVLPLKPDDVLFLRTHDFDYSHLGKAKTTRELREAVNQFMRKHSQPARGVKRGRSSEIILG